MDLTFSQDQQMIQSAARDFLQKECTPAYVRAMERHAKGYTAEHWNQMAELGWMGLPFDEEYGGAGCGFLELCTLLEEHGRFRLPGPFFSTVVLAGLAISRFGSNAQKAVYLPAIASGTSVMSYAETESGGGWDTAAIRLAARAEGRDFVLDGIKQFVPYAASADVLLVAARTSAGDDDGITLFLVDAGSPGIGIQPLHTIGADHQDAVLFNGVRVPGDRLLGKIGEGSFIVEAIRQWGAAARCAEIAGGAQRVLDMTLDYAVQRMQFGKPIGSFQAVQHHCADMAVDVMGTRLLAYEAIWRLSEGMAAAEEVYMAKAWASDAYRRVCATSHQIHGAIGFTSEFDLQLYSRHAKTAELSFGDADYCRERVARLMGL